jgi:light-regulated signal transduction histidine kinase (bacteriophytochrome)
MTDEAGTPALDHLQQTHTQLLQDAVVLHAQLENALARVNQLQFSVAHDLRAPLRHVTAFVQVIREDHESELSAEVQGHLKTIQDAAQTMNAILDSHLKA